jgi:hypothetical protein
MARLEAALLPNGCRWATVQAALGLSSVDLLEISRTAVRSLTTEACRRALLEDIDEAARRL